MKTVLIKYDVSNDLIKCPDRVVENVDYNIGGIFKWIENDPEGAKYKMKCPVTGKIGHWINTDTVLQYLNSKCIKESEEKARLVKSNVSKKTKADFITEF